MSLSYEYHDVTRAFVDILRLQAHLTARQTEALLAPYQAWLNSPFNPMRFWSGTKVAMSGLETLARMNPFLAGFTAKMPNSIEVTFETTNDNDDDSAKPGDRKNLKLVLSLNEPHKNWEALAEIFNQISKEYPKPDFRIDTATVLGKTHQVKQSVLVDKPFASLRLFETNHKGPLLYIAAPLSGHYSTLIRETIQSALNGGFRVAIYDTKNARDIPKRAGEFGLDDCVDYHREFIEHLAKNVDPRVNVQAICQATVPVSMAAATLAEEGLPYIATLDLDAGPIDPYAGMTEVTEFAQKYDIGWFKQNLIAKVPAWHSGGGREVYPGFRQIAAFISMNPDHHTNSFYEMFNHVVRGTDEEEIYKKMHAFYEEYLSVCDLPGKFYLDTIERVFIKNQLAKGEMTWCGKHVDLSAYKGPLLTKEASLDDIAAPGQTMRVHQLMPDAKGYHYTLEGAGHYGIFAGSKARDKGLPVMFAFIHKAMKDLGFDYGPALDSYGNAMRKPPLPEAFRPEMLTATLAQQKKAWADFVEKRGTVTHNVPQFTITVPHPGFKAA